MALTNVPMPDSTRLISVRNGAVTAIGACLALVPDSTTVRGVKLPATDAVLTDFAGMSIRTIAASSDGEAIAIEGDIAIATASGTIAKGDRVFIDTATGNEGQLKAYTTFGAAGMGAKMIVGTALTAASDLEFFEVRLSPGMVGDGFQAGVATLAGGTVTVTGVTLTATSRILISRKTAGGTAGTGGLYAPSANRNTGASTFEIRSADTAGALVATDTSVVDWVVLG